MNEEVEQYQAKFILNAIKDGWTVSMNDKGEIEFTRKMDHYTGKLSEIKNNNYSKKFLEKYGSVAAI